MSVYIPDELRARIVEADGNRCAYCQTSEVNSGIPLSIDHLQPQSEDGQTVFENLCQACRACNEFKGSLIEAEDPLTGETAALFNPRTQRWKDHFEWSADGNRVQGLTATGRATVVALQMNRAAVIAARSRWVSGGWHPPID